jgi:hypothetical protein
MGKSIRVITKKRRGRPVTTGKGTLIGVRLLDEPLATLDDWIARQKEAELTRPEAIRRLVELGLTVKAKVRQSSEGQRLRASEMAGKAIDKMTDTAATPDDQAGRKKRLLKGPEEFQTVRVDRPTRKT